MFNMQKMMKQAQEMQLKLQEVQEKLVDIEIDAESGGGLVKVRMSCAGKVVRIDIDNSLLETDKETLEDLITAAINTANQVKDDRIKEETKSMMEGMGLPEGFAGQGGGLPF
tara:strand:+ start:13720 stop:14055 length:336 start_codon:yes stop_codon:yes gene_type:complete